MFSRPRLPQRIVGLVVAILIVALARAAATTHAGFPLLQDAPAVTLEAPAATGPLLSYQGRLADPTTGNPKSGTFAMTFRLYGVATGGTALWTEGPKNITASNGQFSTLLGDTTALNLTIFDGRDLWLGVQVGSDLEAAPRIQVAYAPYALYAGNSAKLGGQLPGAFAASTHQHSAADITSGTLNYAQFSAYGDLQNEAKIGAGATQVAAGDHLHDGRYYTQGDANSLFVNDNAGEVGNPDVPDGALSPTKITGTAWTSGNDGSGTGLDADLLDGNHSNAFATASHNHLGQTWTWGTNANALVLEGTVGWSNSLLRVYNHSSGPSIWGINDGGGNAVRGQGGGESFGVYGQAENAAGVAGRSSGNDGVTGTSSASGRSGVYGYHEGSGYGVGGKSYFGPGVYGEDAGPNPDDSWAVWAQGDMRTTGDLSVELTLYVGGPATFAQGKSGFVVDIAQNDDTVPLLPGDVVSISGVGPPVLGEIPLIKVRRATVATATGVVGVVDGRFTLTVRALASGVEGAAQEKVETAVEAVAVDPGQYLTVVTLGAYKAIKVDATYGPVSPGDLLVASPNPGYAMRSAAPQPGTVIGKSLGSLAAGTGLVPVVITLQ